jgi:hypothetical protein
MRGAAEILQKSRKQEGTGAEKLCQTKRAEVSCIRSKLTRMANYHLINPFLALFFIRSR